MPSPWQQAVQTEAHALPPHHLPDPLHPAPPTPGLGVLPGDGQAWAALAFLRFSCWGVYCPETLVSIQFSAWFSIRPCMVGSAPAWHPPGCAPAQPPPREPPRAADPQVQAQMLMLSGRFLITPNPAVAPQVLPS